MTNFLNFSTIYSCNRFNLINDIASSNENLNNIDQNQNKLNSLYPHGLYRYKRPTNFFNNSISRPNSRVSSPTTRYSRTTGTTDSSLKSDREAHLFDFPLMGDDFFLYLARMELKCKFKKSMYT